MKRTNIRRRNRKAAVGVGRKREVRAEGTTPKFAIHKDKEAKK